VYGSRAVVRRLRVQGRPDGQGCDRAAGSGDDALRGVFFSSGAVEEGWTRADLIVNRLNVYIGFPLGGLLSLALMVGATLFLEPRGIVIGGSVTDLPEPGPAG
jgi:hypothetical protein